MDVALSTRVQVAGAALRTSAPNSALRGKSYNPAFTVYSAQSLMLCWRAFRQEFGQRRLLRRQLVWVHIVL